MYTQELVRSSGRVRRPNWRKHGVWSGSCNLFIQVIRAYAAVATGTMVTPHFILLRAAKRLPGLLKTLFPLPQLQPNPDMISLSKRVPVFAQVFHGYTVAGKTGTGQQVVEEAACTARIRFCFLLRYREPSESDLMVYVGLVIPTNPCIAPAAVVFAICKDAAIRLNIQPINN